MPEEKANEESESVLPGGSRIEAGKKPELPPELPILPLKNQVAFPIAALPLAVEGDKNVKLVDEVAVGDRMLGVVTQRDEKVEDPGPDELYTVGTAGLVVRMLRVPDGTQRVLIQPLHVWRRALRNSLAAVIWHAAGVKNESSINCCDAVLYVHPIEVR